MRWFFRRKKKKIKWDVPPPIQDQEGEVNYSEVDKEREMMSGSGDLVVKSNTLIEAHYKLKALEQKFLWYMITRVEPEDEVLKWYRINDEEVCRICDEIGSHRDGKARSLIWNAITDLQTKPIRWVENGVLYQTTWITTAKEHLEGDKEGEKYIRFDEELKPHLLQLKKSFTKWHLMKARKLQSQWSIRFYEILKQYENIERRVMEYQELRYMLGCDEYDDKKKEPKVILYSRFTDFKKRVLDAAKYELKEKSDIYFDYDVERDRKRIVRKLIFKIYQNKDAEKDTSLFAEVEDSDPSIVNDLIDGGLDKTTARSIWKKQWNTVLKTARDDIDKTEITFTQYLREKIELLRLAENKGTIENPAGWLLSAIKYNWINVAYDKQKEDEYRAVINVKYGGLIGNNRKKLNQLEKEYKAIINERIKKLFEDDKLFLEVADKATKPPTYESDLSLRENYNSHPSYTACVDVELQEMYPQKLRDIKGKYDKIIKKYNNEIERLEDERNKLLGIKKMSDKEKKEYDKKIKVIRKILRRGGGKRVEGLG